MTTRKRFGAVRRAVPMPVKNFLYRYYYAAQAWGLRTYASARLRANLRQRYALDRERLLTARAAAPATLLTDPLISVVIATYNRGELLAARTLPSVLEQTYSNFEIVVVGDACTDDTAERMAGIRDPRVRFFNLPRRGQYPANPRHHWMVAGADPMNRALDEARGVWIAHLDDDDVFAPDHLAVLLAYAQAHDLEVVYSQMRKQIQQDQWIVQGTPWRSLTGRHDARALPQIPHSTVLFRAYLNVIAYDAVAWRFETPGDQYRWLRMIQVGVRFGFVERITVASPLRPGTTRPEIWAEDRG